MSENNEAAKYRIKLREVEAERDALNSQLDASQRATVTAAVASRVQDVNDFWTHTDIASLRDDDGNVSTEKVDTVVSALLESKPHYQKQHPVTESVSTVHGGDRVCGGNGTPSWQSVLRGDPV